MSTSSGEPSCLQSTRISSVRRALAYRLAAFAVIEVGPGFGMGAAAGINAWFSILLRLLERYKDSIRPAAVKRVVRLMGWALLLGGLYLARGAYLHFFPRAAPPPRSLQDEAALVEGMVAAAEQQQQLLLQEHDRQE